ncbi:MAG: non-ribosomal peptide synthetase, partial [Gammaproteobacteria bacterium]|nr:non-ribosomal peptide synthetase [Gammaproteobacteria bacterium]
MYRTGDLGRWRSDGTIEFGGRADDQVKLRGFRIEPGEIASVLSGIEGVGQAAVVLREVAGEPRLVAYLTAARGGDLPETEALRTGLSSRLPDYMIPSAFVELDTLPLTTSGKLDRRALPMPEITGSATYVAPRTAHEALLARLFGELTGADRVIGRIRAETGLELPLRSVFSHASVTALAHLLDEASESTMPSIVAGSGRDASGTVQLSFGQERLWMLDRLEGGSSQYNIPFALELNGVLDATRLASALRALVLRHEPLRTVIQIEDGDPVGSVLEADAVGCVLELHNLCTSPAALEQHLNAVAGHVFDLGRSPSLYGRLLELAPERHVLALVVHHGAMDGSSLPVLMQELSTLYRGETLPPLPWAYSDHAAWQRNWLQESGTLERGLSYWRDHLSGAPEVLELPLDHVREADRDRRAGYVPVSLNPELGQELNRLAQESGTTVFSVLLSAWGLLLGRLARQDEVVIGTPVAGRMAPGSEALIGFFVNTLALRLDLSGDVDRSALLARVHSVITGGLEHQDTPFEQVVDRLEVARSLSHAPLFQAMFAWQSQEQGAFALDGISTSLLPVTLEQAKFDVTLSLGPGTDGSITGMLEYDTDLFAAETAKHWVDLLEHVVKGLLAAEVGQPRLSSFNATSRVVPETLVPDLFSEVARRTPEATAVIAGEEDLSYGDLEAASNRLARYLIGVGAGPDRVIGICMDRSIAMIVAILGVMKSGAAYLPLDPGHPEERLREMLEDSQALAVLTEPAMKPVLDKVCQVYVPTAPDTAQDIATHSPNIITDEDRIEHLRP